jgi:DNA-binding NarL/FixJ family response regulator
MQKTTVLLADDHVVVRQGFKALLAGERDIQVIGEADNGRLAVEMTRKLMPDVVIMDIAMPLLNGLIATQQITHEMPATKVLILSSYCDDEYLSQLTATGAAGYLIKQTAAEDVVRAIREARKGNAFFSPSISRRLLDQFRDAIINGRTPRQATPQLSSRAMEVVQLIAEGKANKQIASELSISIKTVEKHRQRVMNTLDIHNTAGLTRFAVAKGLVEGGAVTRLSN